MSIVALVAGWWLLVLLSPIWIVLAAMVDLVRGRTRVPLLRLLTFAVCWTSIELAGVAVSVGLWVVGRARDQQLNYALQRWWANALMVSLRVTCGVRIQVSGTTPLPSGPLIVLSRHASLADSLVSAWVLGNKCGRQPRYVLKKELALDPCLDIVGHRLPNHFVDRESGDAAGEVDALRALVSNMQARDAVVIFPEGTRSNELKRARRLGELAERNPERAQRLSGLRHLLPPRPSGTAALLETLPQAQVVVCAHTGFDGMDTFKGMIQQLRHGALKARFDMMVVARPSGDAVEWLDGVWLDLDRRVSVLGVQA